MSYQLNFEYLYQYKDTEKGILLPLQLKLGEKSIVLTAKLDTGASHCIFQRGFGEALGLEIESGIREDFNTVTGNFVAYGHEVLLMMLNCPDLSIEATVYFAADYGFRRDVVGRQGWLDRLRVAIIDYDATVFLSKYDD